jgi:hypothetical protein
MGSNCAEGQEDMSQEEGLEKGLEENSHTMEKSNKYLCKQECPALVGGKD